MRTKIRKSVFILFFQMADPAKSHKMAVTAQHTFSLVCSWRFAPFSPPYGWTIVVWKRYECGTVMMLLLLRGFSVLWHKSLCYSATVSELAWAALATVTEHKRKALLFASLKKIIIITEIIWEVLHKTPQLRKFNIVGFHCCSFVQLYLFSFLPSDELPESLHYSLYLVLISIIDITITSGQI